MSLFIHFLEILTFCLVAALFYRLHSTYKQSLLEDSSHQSFSSLFSPARQEDQSDEIISAVRTLKRQDLKRQDPEMDLPVMLDQVTEAVNIVQSTVAELEMTLAELNALETAEATSQVKSIVHAHKSNEAVTNSTNLPAPDNTPAAQIAEPFSSADDALNDYIGDFFAGTDSDSFSESSYASEQHSVLADAGVDEALMNSASVETLKESTDASNPAGLKTGSRFAVGS